MITNNNKFKWQYFPVTVYFSNFNIATNTILIKLLFSFIKFLLIIVIAIIELIPTFVFWLARGILIDYKTRRKHYIKSGGATKVKVTKKITKFKGKQERKTKRVEGKQERITIITKRILTMILIVFLIGNVYALFFEFDNFTALWGAIYELIIKIFIYVSNFINWLENALIYITNL
jgi:hypothetical protein